jgi:hypothetical protein
MARTPRGDVAMQQRLLAASILAVGFVLGGWFVGHGFAARAPQRIVTVKGLAERNVRADLAVWPLRFAEAGNNLAAVQARVQRDTGSVRAFLALHGLGEAVAQHSLQVTDRAAQQWGSPQYKDRYIVSATLLVRSHDVSAVATAAQATGQLVGQGVALQSQGPEDGPSYLFTGVNAIKPQLLTAAIKAARSAAAQFAHDSGSRLGPIVRANQGLIEILPRDPAPGARQQQQIDKTVRVVATLDYALRG